jgi:hypothetical protein
VDQPLPLSFTQRRVVGLSPQGPADPALNIVYGVRLLGSLGANGDVLERSLRSALSKLLERHALLRTRFLAPGTGGPADTAPSEAPPSRSDVAPGVHAGSRAPATWRQLTEPVAEAPFAYRSLRALSPEAREAELRRIVDEQAAVPFDLSAAPLLRLWLFELSDAEHVLVIATHQLVFDGWSFGVLLDELGALYLAELGAGAPPPPPPLRYTDHALQQLAQEERPQERAFWEKLLRAPLPHLTLRTDRPRPPVRTLRGANHCFRLDPASYRAALRLGHAEAATPFMTFLAGYLLLLHQESGQSDLLVGTPVAGRDRVELERMIGPFVNHLVFRGDLSGDPPFRLLLRRVRDLALDLYEQKSASFERLRERYATTDDPSRAPLFQTRFLVHNTPPPRPAAGLSRGDSIDAQRTVAFFDLSLGLEDKNGWCGSFEYSTDLFERESVERLVREYERLLALAAAEPDRPVSHLVCPARTCP